MNAIYLEGAVEAVGAGPRLVVRNRLLPHGPLRPVTPLIARYLHRAWRRNLAVIKDQLENAQRGDPDASRSGVRERVRQHA